MFENFPDNDITRQEKKHECLNHVYYLFCDADIELHLARAGLHRADKHRRR